MSKTYFLRDTNAETDCDGPEVNGDLSETQGASAEMSSNSTASESFVEVMRFALIDTDIPESGDQDIDYSFEVIEATDIDYEFRAVLVQSSICAQRSEDSTGSLSGRQTATGTFSLTPFVGSGADQLQLKVLIKRVSGTHGNKSITLQVNDADTTLLVPWSAAPVTGVLPSLSLTGIGA
jgi:hypothetical protein